MPSGRAQKNFCALRPGLTLAAPPAVEVAVQHMKLMTPALMVLACALFPLVVTTGLLLWLQYFGRECSAAELSGQSGLHLLHQLAAEPELQALAEVYEDAAREDFRWFCDGIG